jgi:hypothetical protein
MGWICCAQHLHPAIGFAVILIVTLVIIGAACIDEKYGKDTPFY